MQFSSPLIPGVFLRRYKRFFADVRLDDGRVVIAHCANSGSMKTCFVEGGRVWLTHDDLPQRKLKYTWQIAAVGRTRIFLHPTTSNTLAKEAIERGTLVELTAYSQIQTEPRINPHTRFDLLLTRADGGKCFVEVKSATLAVGPGRIAFPDAVSERATKHLHELVNQAKLGNRAVLLFSANRTDALSVEPAAEIDPVYAEALRWASRHGVEILAYRAAISTKRVELSERIAVLLEPTTTATPGPSKERQNRRR